MSFPARWGVFVILSFVLAWVSPVCAQDDELRTPKELAALVAPVALYPDALLAQVLMAASYPGEVADAASWTKSHKDLKGSARTKALEKLDWDPSVKSLCEVPDLLVMLAENREWSTDLGEAFVTQRAEVMKSVQKLRKQAKSAGTLKSTKQQKVIVEEEVIKIVPATKVVYVPQYSVTTVYGTWMYPSYPPTVVHYTTYSSPSPAAAATIGFVLGYAIANNNDYWCGWNWHSHSVWINTRSVHYGRIGGRTTVVAGNTVNVNRTWTHNSARAGSITHVRTGARVNANRRPTTLPAQRPGAAGPTARRPTTYPVSNRRAQQPDNLRRLESTNRNRPSTFSGMDYGRSERLASERGKSSRGSGGRSISNSSVGGGSFGGGRAGGRSGGGRGGRRR